MSDARFLTGFSKALVYARIILHIPCHYLTKPHYFSSPAAYFRFLRGALQLLLIFRHNKIVRVFNGYKLHLYLPAYPSRAFFHAIESKLLKQPAGPTTVVFSMTKACSYRCKHCYQHYDKGRDLDEETMLATARKVTDAGVAMFDIEGGEPFMRFKRLLKLVETLDERSEIWLNTTGAGAKPGMLESLSKKGLFGLMVSIHSPDPAIHDKLTGVAGSFQAASDILKAAHDLGLVTAFNTVLSENELKSGGIDRIMELGRELDCDFVQLIHPKPAGVWLGRTEEMQTDQTSIEIARTEHLRYNGRSRKGYPALAAQVFEEAPYILGCTAGAVDRFYVGASGEVQPCEFLNISFGNVNEEPFEQIFARMRFHFKEPCTDWLCCTQALGEIFKNRESTDTPLPWEETRKLVENWERGDPTPIYKKLGIYR